MSIKSELTNLFYNSLVLEPPQIFIKSGLLYKIKSTIQKLGFFESQTLLISDKHIWKNCKKYFDKDFACNLHSRLEIFEDISASQLYLERIVKIVENHREVKLIIALGSGTINDLCKLASAKTNIPYLIIPSAASMNGYLSKNASIEIDGHKKTLAATLPIAVICDLNLISNAPLRLTRSGIGDSLCFYSCWFDWYLSHICLNTKFSETPFTILEPKIKFLIKNFHKFSLDKKDKNFTKFIKLLVEILLISGAGMTIAGGSYPASQSEHLIAHAIGMKYSANKLLHGEQISITSISSSKIQEWLIDNIAKIEVPIVEASEKVIKDFFNDKIVAQECLKEYMAKQNQLPAKEKIKKNIIDNLDRLTEIHLSPILLKRILTHFELAISYKAFGLSKQEYQECVSNAKFIRSRFTCLDLIA